jgi:hypothetical protein
VLERERLKVNPNDFDVMVLCYWLMFQRAPGQDTLPGEPVDLGEIGKVAEKSWSRDTPLFASATSNAMNFAAYAEYKRLQREYERTKWIALSEAERSRLWLRRQMYLWTQFLLLDRKWVHPTVGCPACGPFHLVAHSWPEHFECVCGTFVILDRWLPDNTERITMMTYEGLDKFRGIHAKAFDLYDYPLEERLKDLGGL